MMMRKYLGISIVGLVILVCFCSPAFAQTVLVPPYLQPGNSPTLAKEQKVLVWQTDSVPGTFKVEYTLGSEKSAKPAVAKVTNVTLNLINKTTLLYRANLSKLKFDATYSYQVSLNGKVLTAGSFETRTKKPKTRFAVFGDCGVGSTGQKQIAYQVYQQKPQFVLLTGDNVYNNGREMEYRARFFPYYLASEASPEKGAPLMNSVPFYMLLGNHDIYSSDFTKYPDGLAFFYYTDLPLNAPVTTLTVKPEGDPARIKSFQKNTTPRFPRTANYSFDHGNVHIAVLDANTYVNPLDPALVQWLANDMKSSKADWKIVTYHQPAFNSSKRHYEYQIMRLLAPVCEELGVDLVLNGHVHNYQRTVPLKFAPKKDSTGMQYVVSNEGSVDGTFTLDNEFDGKIKTHPNGIIYIVTGAGGAGLYDADLSDKPELWKKGTPENWAPYTSRLVSDIHSFTMIETDGKKLTLQQLDGQGKVFDQIIMTK